MTLAGVFIKTICFIDKAPLAQSKELVLDSLHLAEVESASVENYVSVHSAHSETFASVDDAW